ncbi:MAG TPA: hypothetical protein VEI97_16450 [bacterium]|nr:hypothetical protein [bacterium]
MYLGVRDVAQFGILVGLMAIFADAAIAHGLFWHNDPYWTYWVTKTLLITTVFTISTAFFGIGIKQGLITTVIHTFVLEMYYDWFAPIGLPQEPQWLGNRDLWGVGFLAHYLAIFGGYAMALWIWRRHRTEEHLAPSYAPGERDPRGAAWFALLGTVIILVLDGIITHGLLLRDFPGWTYFIQHLLLTFAFLYAWSAFVGFDTSGWLVGAVTLSLTWITYGMFVGPVGLPFEQPRYLGYEELWGAAFPGALLSSLVGLWIVLTLPKLREAVRTPVPALSLPPEMRERGA